jgi:XRE family aerobic/anaerobic benzoate catabolism transcriptional regulator
MATMATARQMGKRLKQLREAKQWSQVALAQRARLSREYVLRLEAGQQDPSLSTLRALAKALGLPVTKLLE